VSLYAAEEMSLTKRCYFLPNGFEDRRQIP
jgi:hypothetical protein